MNDMAPVGSTAIALPEGTALAAVFRAENGIDPIIAAIAAEVRAHVPDISTKKGRDAIASLAYRVSRSKTVLDDAGKSLNEAARAEISIVDAARRKVREQLDALRDEARKPLDDWEAAEEQRLNLLKSRLRALDAGRADVTQSADHIAAVLAEVEATEIGEDWQEYQGQAAIAKDQAVTILRRNLEVARKREADAAELERLRAEDAKRAEAERGQREAEEAERRLADRAERARAYIGEVGRGLIGGQPQAYAILIYELQTKLPPLIAELGVHSASVDDLRKNTLADLSAAAAKQQAEAEARAEADRKESAERAAKEAEEAAERKLAEEKERHEREIAEAKRRADEAAQRERDRLADERRAEAEAQQRREENTRIRNRIKREIAKAIDGMTADEIAEALTAGRVPHCTVSF